MSSRIVVSCNSKAVRLWLERHRVGSHPSYHELEGGEFDLAGAVDLAADLLKNAGRMLALQAAELRAGAAKINKANNRKARTTKPPQEPRS